jgi:hypothetical protein
LLNHFLGIGTLAQRDLATFLSQVSRFIDHRGAGKASSDALCHVLNCAGALITGDAAYQPAHERAWGAANLVSDMSADAA